MLNGQMILGRERPGRLLGWGIRFFLTAALSAAQTPGGCAPFALGAVAAAGPGADGAAALAGAGIGALVFLDFSQALPFLAVGVLLLTAATAFQGVERLNRPLAVALTAAGLSLAVGGIYAVESLDPLSRLAPCVAAAGLTGASAWFLLPVLRPGEERQGADGLLFLAAALALSLTGLEVLGVSVGRALLCLLLVCAAYDRGAAAGAAAGLGMGLAADFCAGTGGGVFTAGLGLAGLAAGQCSGCRRGAAALAFSGAALASLLPATAPLAAPLALEAGLGAGAFLLLPRRFFGGKRVRRSQQQPPAGDAVRKRLAKAAAALREVYDSMGRSSRPNEENPAVIFDRAAERVCRGCALCALCWQQEYTATFNAMNDATPTMLERGRVMAKDFPRHFADRCIHLTELISAINTELSAFLLRRQYRRQLDETRRSARGQYAQFSELLTAAAAGLGESVPAAGEADFTCRVGAALRPKEGETVCGDTLASFRTETGLLCLLLADGMGSGEAARKESALTCRLLQQFLEAGIAPEAAMKTLNAAMALRGAESGSFTTVDLCAFRATTGEVAFYKYGAAPSYVKKGGTVRRITGGSLPAGLRGAPAQPDVTRLHLEAGSFAVMVSDGVADPEKDDWLQDLLAGWQGDDPQTLAGLILAESIRREKLKDDCGIQVLYRAEEPAREV